MRGRLALPLQHGEAQPRLLDGNRRAGEAADAFGVVEAQHDSSSSSIHLSVSPLAALYVNVANARLGLRSTWHPSHCRGAAEKTQRQFFKNKTKTIFFYKLMVSTSSHRM